MADFPAGTVTFLFTDIEGSTRLLQHLGEEAYGAVLADHREIVRRAIAEHRGAEVDTQGDSFFVAFARAPDALAAAVAMQRGLASHPWPGEAAVRVRMGVHTGEVRRGPSGYVGLAVHQAARISAVAHGGQVLVSHQTRVVVGHELPDDVSLIDLGSHRLKDLTEPQHLFQVRHPALPSDFPPLRSLERWRHNLPVQLTSFVERREDMTEVADALSSSRLLTLSGAGGAGKTRLALQVAAELVQRYPDGVWVVELAALTDPALMAQQVATALGLRDEPGRTLTETIVDYLRSRTLLLVLDNCEHMVDAVADLTIAVLEACAGVRVLATSRQPLGIPGERVWKVPSLAVPPEGHHGRLEELESFGAVRLFVERANLATRDFCLTSANADAVAQIVRRLDGIPLAIELAAARTRVLTVPDIAKRLHDRFRILTGGARTSLPRQRTLRALVDWSYDLLNDCEQLLLRRLSVFAGGFSLEAAEAVASGGPVDPYDVLELLTSLVDKSLVTSEVGATTTRYAMLETIREYAAERLREHGEEAALVDRHRDWYLRLCGVAEAALVGPDQGEWLAMLEEEHDNLRQVLQRGTEAGRFESVYCLASAIWRFWWIRGHLREGRSWLEGALSSSQLDPSVRAKALHAAGALAWDQSDFRAARYFLSASRTIFEELGDTCGTAQTLFKLGSVLGLQGDYPEAHRHVGEALRLAEEADDVHTAAECWSQLGQLAMLEGDIDAARRAWERSRDMYTETGDTWGVISSLGGLGEAALVGGQREAAGPLLRESLELARKMGDRWRIARCQFMLGEMARLGGECEQARELHREALGVRREIGERTGIGESLEALAAVAAEDGRFDHAAVLLGAADALRTSLGVPVQVARVADYDRLVARTKEALDPPAFAAAWDEGASMSLDEAVLFASGDGERRRTAAA